MGWKCFRPRSVTYAMGSLIAYVTERGRKHFQPMNANYGLFPPLKRNLRGREKKIALAERGLDDIRRWRDGLGPGPSGAASVA